MKLSAIFVASILTGISISVDAVTYVTGPAINYTGTEYKLACGVDENGNPSGTCSKRPFTQKDCADYDNKTCTPVAKTYTGPQVNGTCYWTGSQWGCQF